MEPETRLSSASHPFHQSRLQRQCLAFSDSIAVLHDVPSHWTIVGHEDPLNNDLEPSPFRRIDGQEAKTAGGMPVPAGFNPQGQSPLSRGEVGSGVRSTPKLRRPPRVSSLHDASTRSATSVTPTGCPILLICVTSTAGSADGDGSCVTVNNPSATSAGPLASSVPGMQTKSHCNG